MTSLLAQKRDIKRQQVLVDRMKADEAVEREVTLERARERVLTDFEHAQTIRSTKGKDTTSTAPSDTPRPSSQVAGTKRKFEIEEDEVARMVRDSEAAALLRIQAEQVLTAARLSGPLGRKLC